MFERALTEAAEDRRWIAEGTASAAASQASTATTMGRGWSSLLRPVNIGLTAHDIESALDGRPPTEDDDLIAMSIAEYLAEDFWAYFGLRENLGLGYLKPLFERGGTTVEAANFFFRDYDTLAEEYWRWVKNQAIEQTIPFADVAQNPCQIQTEAVGAKQVLWYPRPDVPAAFVDGILPRLTSKVIEITLIGRDGLGPTKIVADEAPGLRYRVYLKDEANCAGLADGPRTLLPPLPFGTIVYVVVANTLYWDSLAYKVRLEDASP